MQNVLREVITFARKYYSSKKFAHAWRVAVYAYHAAQHSRSVDPERAKIVGLCHDLIEDTNCPQEELQRLIGVNMFSSVVLLTKDDRTSYHDYIQEIVKSNDDLAKCVKQADIKDHIIHNKKVKKKYLNELQYFM